MEVGLKKVDAANTDRPAVGCHDDWLKNCILRWEGQLLPPPEGDWDSEKGKTLPRCLSHPGCSSKNTTDGVTYKQQSLFLTVPEAGKSKIKADSVSGEVQFRDSCLLVVS